MSCPCEKNFVDWLCKNEPHRELQKIWIRMAYLSASFEYAVIIHLQLWIFLPSRRLSLLRPDLMPCLAGTLYLLVTSLFWRLIQRVLWTSTISLLNIVSAVIFALWFRIGMNGILIRSSPQKSWIYISTALSLRMGLKALFTRINWTITFLSLRLPDCCCVFQAEVMTIFRAA